MAPERVLAVTNRLIRQDFGTGTAAIALETPSSFTGTFTSPFPTRRKVTFISLPFLIASSRSFVRSISVWHPPGAPGAETLDIGFGLGAFALRAGRDEAGTSDESRSGDAGKQASK